MTLTLMLVTRKKQLIMVMLTIMGMMAMIVILTMIMVMLTMIGVMLTVKQIAKLN